MHFHYAVLLIEVLLPLSIKALLHSYFFTPPLPAHHSELPIPNRQPKRSSSSENFDVFGVLDNSIVKPELLEPCAKLFVLSSKS